MSNYGVIEEVQRMVARVVATHREGVGLRLIGGFRYRLIDGSSRMSADLDYHWDADLASKRDELVRLLKRQLLPEVRRRLGLDGSVYAADPPGEESVFVKSLEIAVFPSGPRGVRIEIPVDVTHVPCSDSPVAATVDGVVHLTASDADMLEGKILAVFLRTPTAPRDWVDLFLFRDRLRSDAASRLAAKCMALKLSPPWLDEAWHTLCKRQKDIAAGVDRVLAEQMDPAVADNLRLAGGSGLIVREVMALIENATQKARGFS